MNTQLFSGGDLAAALEKHADDTLEAAIQLAADKVRKDPSAAKAELEKWGEVVPLSFHWDKLTRTAIQEVIVHSGRGGGSTVPGHTVTLMLPFEGNPMLLKCSASTYSLSGFPFDVRVALNTIYMTISSTTLTSKGIMAELERFKKAITERAEWANADVAEWARRFRDRASAAVDRRKAHLDAASVAEDDLGIPIGKAD